MKFMRRKKLAKRQISTALESICVREKQRKISVFPFVDFSASVSISSAIE